MEHISSVAALKEAIVALEIKKIEQGKFIKEQFNQIRENLRPANLIRNSLGELTSSPSVLNNLLGTLAGLTAGYFSRKVVIGKSPNLFRLIAGKLMQIGISAFMINKPALLTTIGKSVISRIFTRKKESYKKIYQN